MVVFHSDGIERNLRQDHWNDQDSTVKGMLPLQTFAGEWMLVPLVSPVSWLVGCLPLLKNDGVSSSVGMIFPFPTDSGKS